jgi:hypothetical protein
MLIIFSSLLLATSSFKLHTLFTKWIGMSANVRIVSERMYSKSVTQNFRYFVDIFYNSSTQKVTCLYNSPCFTAVSWHKAYIKIYLGIKIKSEYQISVNILSKYVTWYFSHSLALCVRLHNQVTNDMKQIPPYQTSSTLSDSRNSPPFSELKV